MGTRRVGKEVLVSKAVSTTGSGCASWAAAGPVGRGAEIGVVISTITSGNETMSTTALGRAIETCGHVGRTDDD